MDTIIAGRFGTKTEADAAADKMHGFVTESDICIFHNNPPGQHRTTLFGNEDAVKHEASHSNPPNRAQANAEADASEQAEKAENTSLATAAVAGVAVGALAVAAGPVAALAAAGVAAYTGSLAGALTGADGDNSSTVSRDGTHDSANHGSQSHAVRQGGAMIAVRLANADSQTRVIDALRSAGAADIEIASGEWHDGDWVDFDPLDTPKFVAPH
jgi:hypothetical protein